MFHRCRGRARSAPHGAQRPPYAARDRIAGENPAGDIFAAVLSIDPVHHILPCVAAKAMLGDLPKLPGALEFAAECRGVAIAETPEHLWMVVPPAGGQQVFGE